MTNDVNSRSFHCLAHIREVEGEEVRRNDSNTKLKYVHVSQRAFMKFSDSVLVLASLALFNCFIIHARSHLGDI